MKTVTLDIHLEVGDSGRKTWWARSSDVPGFSVAGDTFAQLVQLATEGAAFALEEPVALRLRAAGSEWEGIDAMASASEDSFGLLRVPQPV